MTWLVPGAGGYLKRAFTGIADVVVTNTVTPTSVFSPSNRTYDGGLMIPANSAYVGQTYEFVVRGKISTDIILPGDFTVTVKLGGVTIATAVRTSTLIGLIVSRNFDLRGTLTMRALGSTGKVRLAGDMRIDKGDGTFAGEPLTADTETTVDTTVDRSFDILAAWSSARAGNILTIASATVNRQIAA